MELYAEILAQALTNGDIQVILRGLDCDVLQVVEKKCYLTLLKIKSIVDDDRLDDPECFMRIEEVVCALEELGCYTTRHDFG